jgi:hypothetical protein
MNMSGCTVIAYRMLVSIGASVIANEAMSTSGSATCCPCRQAATTPAANNAR